MEITKEVLEFRLSGMTEQLGMLLEQQAMVRGAINICNELIKYLETPEPEEKEHPEEAGIDAQTGLTEASFKGEADR